MNSNLLTNTCRKSFALKRRWAGPFALCILAVFVFTVTSCIPQAQACCVVINVGAQNTVTARDTKTGRTFQFQFGQTDGLNLKNGDTIGADLVAGKVTSVKGVAKTYPAFEPENAEPCCNIVSIQPDPAEPCCGVVIANNNLTGETFQFKAEGETLVKNLSMGQAVNVIGNWAAVQSSAIPGYGNRQATFSFAVNPNK